MIRYKQSRQQSAELLRLALAQIGQHEAAANPTTYAVWYEHASGTNPRLTADIEKCLLAEPRLGDATIERLYREHIAEIDEATAERVRESFGRVMAELSQSAAHTGDSANAFGERLSTGRHTPVTKSESPESRNATCRGALRLEHVAGTLEHDHP